MWEPIKASAPAPPASAPAQPSPAPSEAQSIPGATPPPPAAQPAPASAVQRCCSAYDQALRAAGGPKASGAEEAAGRAFKKALPFLTDRASILDFMACITHGMVLGVFSWYDHGPRLIAAARATLAALPRDPAPIPEHAAKGGGRPPKKKQESVLEKAIIP